jgi:hypothetical protein
MLDAVKQRAPEKEWASYGARVTERNGSVHRKQGNSVQGLVEWADREFPGEALVSIRTTHTSDGTYWPGHAGREVAQRFQRQWSMGG